MDCNQPVKMQKDRFAYLENKKWKRENYANSYSTFSMVLWHTTINEYLSKNGLKENRGRPD